MEFFQFPSRIELIVPAGWLLLFAIVGVAGIDKFKISRGGSKWTSKKKHSVRFFTVLVAELLLLNIIFLVIVAPILNHGRRSAAEQPDPTVHAAAAAYGLNSGQEYPVLIGDRADGTTGEGYFHSGLFGASGKFSVQPGSGVVVGYATEDGNSYLLTLPADRVVFRQVEGAEPSMQLYLHDSVTDGYGEMSSVEVAPTTCDWKMNWFVLNRTCNYTPVNAPSELILSDNAERRGLAPLVTDHFDSAVITLPPELYQELVGG